MARMNEKPRRRWFRFSLRTLFVLVTLLGCVMGWVVYSLSWIRQRDELLYVEGVSAGFYMPADNRPRGPGLLWIFEGGFDFVEVVIDAPKARQGRGPVSGVRTQREQELLERAASLYPEAEVQEVAIERWRREMDLRNKNMEFLRQKNSLKATP
jgi:hypothetical protein